MREQVIVPTLPNSTVHISGFARPAQRDSICSAHVHTEFEILTMYDGHTEFNVNEQMYIVEKGDTLYSVAKKFDISVNKLKEYNNLGNNLLSIGQKILIPIQQDTTYVVKRGDTLYSIAREFNTTVDEIKRLNSLFNNNLSIGQILILKDL